MSAARVELDVRPLRSAAAGVIAGAATLSVVGARTGIACPLRSLTGVPCPFCGMTRGLEAVARGDLVSAVRFNPGSVMLVVAAVALLVAWRRPRVRFPRWLPYALLAGLWAFELAKYASGAPL